MAIDLTGNPIAITGASSGIGRATALACARAGMPVALGARREEKLVELADEINAMPGGRAIAVRCDVTNAAECEAFIDRTVDAFGSIYSVFANAGYGSDAKILEMTDSEVRAIFDTNFFGTLDTIRPAVIRMRSNGGSPRGHVIICSSCVARFTVVNLSAYSATKAAQAHVGTALRQELKEDDIRVSTVHPIGTRTDFFDAMQHVHTDDGKRHHSPAFFTQPVSAVSDRVVKCLRSPRAEVWTGPKGAITRMTSAMMTAWPWFGDRVVKGSAER